MLCWFWQIKACIWYIFSVWFIYTSSIIGQIFVLKNCSLHVKITFLKCFVTFLYTNLLQKKFCLDQIWCNQSIGNKFICVSTSLDLWKIEFKTFKSWSNHHRKYYLMRFIDSETVYRHIQKTLRLCSFLVILNSGHTSISRRKCNIQ